MHAEYLYGYAHSVTENMRTESDEPLLVDELIFDFYPNPYETELFIKSSVDIDEEVLIRIYDSEGKLVYNRGEFFSSSTIIDLDNISSGIYYVHINGMLIHESAKFVVLK